MRILLVEDEPRAAQMLAKGLREEAYAVDVVGDGESAVYQTSITDYDAIILDVVLPLQDGLAVCREIRREGSLVPVLMLTARDAVEARIAGLDSGADDYLTKPFDFGELLARLRAVIRRGRRPLTPSIVRVGPLELDTRARRALRHGEPLVLTAREYALLEHLVLHADQVVGRADIAEHVWDAHPARPQRESSAPWVGLPVLAPGRALESAAIQSGGAVVASNWRHRRPVWPSKWLFREIDRRAGVCRFPPATPHDICNGDGLEPPFRLARLSSNISCRHVRRDVAAAP